jgi:BirA family biotin operon repressor/biotin-[acetyl-CoA-carboxylase] ligase
VNPERIKAAICPDNLQNLADLIVFDTIDSTNTYLLSCAKKGAPSGTVCFADEQTAGRGRQGKAWFSPPEANIYGSLLWRFNNLSALSGLSIAVAVMIVRALKKYGVRDGLQLKWPNDVWYAQRKLAGILLECSGNNVVIGIGLNLKLPSDADPNWIDLTQIMQQPIEREKIAGLLVNEMLVQLPVYEQHGLTAFLNEWRQYDACFQRMISVHTPEKIFSGVMEGINEKGELLLRDAEGNVQRFCYGEVSVKRM